MADRRSQYRPVGKKEPKTKVITYRLTEADAEALLGTSANTEASLNDIARLAAIERIERHEEEVDKEPA